MAKYNLMDCQVNLELCRHQDLLNQIVGLCRITRSYILDVMIYSTGAMAASSLCSYALKQNKHYVWTRCDHYPKEFIGGHVHFRSPIVCSSPMICNFVSMYLSIMKCANISPETIYYIDKETYGKQKFEFMISKTDLLYNSYVVWIGITYYGVKKITSSGCNFYILIGKYCRPISSTEEMRWDLKQSLKGVKQLTMEVI